MDRPADIQSQPQGVVVTQTFDGPYPPPALLQAYEKVYPGAAQEIFNFTKENQQHMIWMDREGAKAATFRLKSTFILGLFGQIGTTVIAVSGLVLAFLRPNLAIPGFAFSAGIVGYLIWWKNRQTKENKQHEREEKKDMATLR